MKKVKPNSKLIILSLLFLLSLTCYSQPIDKLTVKLDSLNTKLKYVDEQIKLLENEKSHIITQIARANKEIHNYKLNQDFSGGILTLLDLDAILRDKPSISGNKIMRIPAGDSVLVYKDYNKPYFKVSYKDKMGFLSYSSMKLNERLNEIIIPNYSSKNKKLKRLNKKFGKSVALKIMNGKYWLGMTKEMARKSLGYPDDINKTSGEWGVHEQWVYEKKEIYLYFENGKLTSFQE